MLKSYLEIREFLREIISEIFKKHSMPRWMLFLHDIVAVFLTFLFAYLLRFNLAPGDFELNHAIIHGLIVLFVYTVFILIFRSYAGLIRHTTLTDVSLVFVSASASAFVLILLSLGEKQLNLNTHLVIPVSILLIHYVLISVYLFFTRIFAKMLFMFGTQSMRIKTRRVLIYGAGEMGFIVKRVLLSDPRGGFSVAGFIDDKRHLQGKKINGIQVFGPDILNSDFIVRHKIQTLILAISDIQPLKKSSIIKKSIDLNIEVLETPAIEKWLNGQLEVRQLKKVQLEDLLGRDPISLDMETIRKGLARKTILVTGAAGSIGSEIVRQLSRFATHNIILVDQAETPIFHLENELRKSFGHMKFISRLADVTNTEKMELIFHKYHPDIVFHAAAYKHVPLMEANPHEALRVNVGGTRVMIELSVKHGVKKFVMISSDKSVNPTNIMGASKRVCEMLVQTKSLKEGVKTQFVITRFGNVLGSNGSVIPLFKKQIEDGGPITVTHPDITRYFMTIPEACQLVLEAGFMGKGGEIFVFDMGKPIKIADLAENMIRLSGLEPGKDIKIEYTGLRPGEKLYEELLSAEEEILPTHHDKIKVAKVDRKDYKAEILKVIASLRCIYGLSELDVIEFFEMLVPEYKSSKENSNGNFLSNGKSVIKENKN
jgi:FlaA1/EpsC-like NDP-sugar epimerase